MLSDKMPTTASKKADAQSPPPIIMSGQNWAQTSFTVQAVAKAMAIAKKSREIPTAERFGKFYERLKKEVPKGYEITNDTNERIVNLLKDPDLEKDEFLRRELWKECNSIAIDVNEHMSEQDKKVFKYLIANSSTAKDQRLTNISWMEWHLKKRGSKDIVGEGSEYFEFFADKFAKEDISYLVRDWYWDYMFYMVNESAEQKSKEINVLGKIRRGLLTT
jgi:hypothetical protein